MPRSGKYIAWSSKNALALLAMPVKHSLTAKLFRAPKANCTVDVRTRNEEGKFENKSYDCTDKKMFEGRPHTEEGYLIQITGEKNKDKCVKCESGDGKFTACISVDTIHKGACGNCVSQSQTNSCLCAAARIAAINDKKEIMMGEKLRQRTTRGTVSSKRKRESRRGEETDSEEERKTERLLKLADARAEERLHVKKGGSHGRGGQKGGASRA